MNLFERITLIQGLSEDELATRILIAERNMNPTTYIEYTSLWYEFAQDKAIYEMLGVGNDYINPSPISIMKMKLLGAYTIGADENGD